MTVELDVISKEAVRKMGEIKKHGVSASGSDELLCCPFCGGEGTETQKGSNYVIVRCESLACGVRPSAVCYEKEGGYDFWPWNNRAT